MSHRRLSGYNCAGSPAGRGGGGGISNTIGRNEAGTRASGTGLVGIDPG